MTAVIPESQKTLDRATLTARATLDIDSAAAIATAQAAA